MKRVILLRHAKSAWDDPDLADHDRPLNDRGRRAAPVIAGWLAQRGYAPDHVLCSTARRTRETWALAAPLLPDAPEPVIEARLYHADPAAMLAAVRAAPDARAALLLIGHQPGLSGFARKLAAQPAPASCARAFTHAPTAAAAGFDFDVDRWADVDWGGGRFVAFAAPRDLV
jgi:phosphohistidine phosphatase